MRIRPMREMRCGVLPCTSLPSNITVPVSGILKPEMRSIAVASADRAVLLRWPSYADA